MRKLQKLLLALALLGVFASPAFPQALVGPPNQIICNQSAFANATSATTTSLVAGVAGKSIFVCGWHVTSILGTSSTFQLEYGTQAGGPCATPTAFTPPFNITSTAPSVDHNDFASTQVPAGAQVCVVTGAGATGTAVLLWYTQF